MKFLIDIPDEHIKKGVALAREWNFITIEELLRDLLFEHFEWVAELDEPYLDTPRIMVTRVDKICQLY